MFARMFTGLAIVLSMQSCDRVTVNNSAGDVGLFVDGQGTPDPVNDFRLSKDDPGSTTFRVGNYTAASSPNRNEVIGFGAERAPTRATTTWTPDDDNFNFGLGDVVPVDITFWIIQGPVSTATFRINDGLTATDTIWAGERTGFVVGDVDIIDATSDPDIDDAILNSVGGNNRNWDDFSDEIGFAPGRINVYYINTVEGSQTMGWSDFGARIVMGFGTLGALLTHEIGHAMSLAHPEDGPFASEFNAQNVMTAFTNSRSWLTEGQTFRAHFDTSSVVNGELDARPGQPVENCPLYDETPACPRIPRRIWADGASFPPN